MAETHSRKQATPKRPSLKLLDTGVPGCSGRRSAGALVQRDCRRSRLGKDDTDHAPPIRQRDRRAARPVHHASGRGTTPLPTRIIVCLKLPRKQRP